MRDEGRLYIYPESSRGDFRRHMLNIVRFLGAERPLSPLSRLFRKKPDVIPMFPKRRRFANINDLAAELLSVAELLGVLVGAGASLEIECLPCAGEIDLDSEELMRILFTLLANSLIGLQQSRIPRHLRFIHITVRTGDEDSLLPVGCGAPYGNGSVVLSIWDNGPGFAPDNLTYVPARRGSWRQLGGARSLGIIDDELHSAGLEVSGLLRIRDIVFHARGCMHVSALHGVGTRVSIEFPHCRRTLNKDPECDKQD